MVNYSTKLKRKADVKARASDPSFWHHTCRVMNCGKPSRAATKDGLDNFFCRTHADHYSRHGSPYKSSYRSKDLAPHRKIARAWLKAHEDDPWVTNAILRVATLYNNAGAHVEAFRLNGLSPQERARAAWARLRKAKVDHMRVVEAALTVELTIAADLQPDGKLEFKRVQWAKQVHKLSSGTHKKWSAGAGGAIEMHKYPRSRGQVLRHIGADIETVVELLLAHHKVSPPEKYRCP